MFAGYARYLFTLVHFSTHMFPRSQAVQDCRRELVQALVSPRSEGREMPASLTSSCSLFLAFSSRSSLLASPTTSFSSLSTLVVDTAEEKLSSRPEGSSARERGAEESNMTGGGRGEGGQGDRDI